MTGGRGRNEAYTLYIGPIPSFNGCSEWEVVCHGPIGEKIAAEKWGVVDEQTNSEAE